MTDHQHLTVLRQGVQAWNQWRLGHRDVQPEFSGAQLSSAALPGIYLSEAQFSDADLSNTDLRGADLRWANLSGANLYRTNFTGANLHEANLCNAHLKGSCFMQAVIQDTRFSGADLSEASFRQANSIGADFSQAVLRETDFTNADLRAANLCDADLRGAKFYRADLSAANLRSADLRGADLSKAILSGTDFSEANLTGCRVYGISAWNVQLEKTIQAGLIISSRLELTGDDIWAFRGRLGFEHEFFSEDEQGPLITVDNLEIAQFIYLLLNHKKLRAVLNAVTDRGVLLLGRFGGGGIEVLQALATKLREEKYLPLLFDFERPTNRNYTETVKTLAGLSRFVVADLSGPSVPQELYATVPHFKIPFVPIIEAGRKPFSMVLDLLEYPWVVRPPVIFASTEELLNLVPSRIINPAEEKHQARQELLDELFRRE